MEARGCPYPNIGYDVPRVRRCPAFWRVAPDAAAAARSFNLPSFWQRPNNMNSRTLLSVTLLALVTAAFAARPESPASETAKPDAVKLDPVVVTAAQTVAPLTVTKDPHAPAQPVPAHDGADVLKDIPGFSVIRKGGTDGDPVLRGSAGSRVGVQLDDQCIFGGCGNRMDPPTAYVFPTAFDRVTVIKGPQSVLHGPGNSAGVILFERDITALKSPAAGADLSSTVASFGRVDGLANIHGGNAVLQGRAIGTYTRSGDYEDGAGEAVHSEYRRWSTHLSAAWTPDASTFLEVSGARSNGEAAYADRTMDGAKFDRTNGGFRFRRTGLSSAVKSVEARAYHNYVDHVMDNYSLRPFVASMMMPNPSVANPDRKTTGGLVQATLVPVDDLEVTIGSDMQSNRHSIRSTMNENMMRYEAMGRMLDARFTQNGGFAEGSMRVGTGGKFVSGLRLDYWKAEDLRKTVAVSMMSTAPNPSEGRVRRSDLLSGFARYELSAGTDQAPVTIYAGVGRVQRFPDYWEMVKNESATSVTSFGVKPETTSQLDAGVLGKNGDIECSVALFAAEIADYLLVQSNVAKPAGMMGTRMAVITRNVDARTLGGEASLSWRFLAHWKLDASIAGVDGENKTDSKPLAQIPPVEGRVGLAYATELWSVGGLVRGVAEQSRVALNQGNIVGQDIGRSPGFAVVSLNVGCRAGKYTRVSAGVDNLFDKTYAEHISRSGASVAGFAQSTRVNEPGRVIWGKVDLSF
jgi:iron complex outermembrane receptor protein